MSEQNLDLLLIRKIQELPSKAKMIPDWGWIWKPRQMQGADRYDYLNPLYPPGIKERVWSEYLMVAQEVIDELG